MARQWYKYTLMNVSVQEAEILRQADEILHKVQNSFGDDNTIISVETGECITPGSLSSARGTLGFVAQYNAVDIQ